MGKVSLLFSRAHAGRGVLYYESHEAPRLLCLSSEARDAAKHHGRCSSCGVPCLPGRAQPQHAWEATGRDGSDRWQCVCMAGVAEIVKDFPSVVLRRGGAVPADFISCSSRVLKFRDPWVRHEGGA